ncbi:uncharacterized protein LOC144444754 isoform X2 [Glandiceps talaboti]
MVKEVFTEKCCYGKVEKVWFHRGHLYVTTAGSYKLLTFDPVQDQDPGSNENEDLLKQVIRRKCLDLSFKSPLINICFSESSSGVTYLVHSNSQVEMWSYNNCKDGLIWMQVKTLTLNTGCEERDVVSAVVCGDVMVYCQAKSTELFSLCQRPLSGTDKESITVFIDNCPFCDLVCLLDKVIIWPRNRELFLIWSPKTYTLQVVMVTMGVIDHKVITSCCDFKSIILRNLRIISKMENNPVCVVNMVKYEKELLLVCEDGSVKSLTSNGVVRSKLKLSVSDSFDVKQVIRWFTYQFTIAAVTSSNTIRFYSLDSGFLVYVFEFDHDNMLHVAEDQETGAVILWNQSVLYQLQMCAQDRLVAEYLLTNDISKLHQRYGDIYIAIKSIVEASRQKTEKCVLAVDGISSICKYILQSPLSLVAIHKCKNSNNITQNMRVGQVLEESGNVSCTQNQLNEDTVELLGQYWTLQQIKQASDNS